MTHIQRLISILYILIASGCSTTKLPVTTNTATTSNTEITLQEISSTPSPVNRAQQVKPSPTSRITATIQISSTKDKTPTATHTLTSTPSRLPSKTPTRTLSPTLGPENWQKMPIVPTISDTVIQVYQLGLKLGNHANAFSKIGDCGSTPAWFLGDFDRGSEFYRLGSHQNLEAVIREFQGSYGRTSLAARSGFNASSLFVPLWADLSQCESNEGPLECEYRVHKPVIAYIMLGANDVWHPEDFEPQMRKIIESSLEKGVIPILSTKADNQEGDGSINKTIARLALEYEIPLWNYWLAVQPLPDQGLQEDKVHLTFGRNFFDDPNVMSKAWPVRNLTALQTLNAVWKKITGQSG